MKRHKLEAFAVSVGAIAGFLVPVPTAQAGECTLKVFCGWIYVKESSPVGIRVTYSWGDKTATDRVIAPGHTSKEHKPDTDGFYTRSGYNITCRDIAQEVNLSFPGTGWHQIHDNDHYSCRQYPEWT